MSYIRADQSVAALSSAREGQKESVNITIPTIDGTYEIQTVACPAFASAAQGDFFILTNYAGTKFAVWLDKDADGTEPAGLLYSAADVQIEVDIVTGETAAQVAAKVKAAIEAEVLFVGFSISIGTATLTFTSTIKDELVDPVMKNAAEDGDGSFVVAEGTAGVAPTIKGKYFLFSSSGVAYYCWFSNNGTGTDPEVATRTGVEVELVGNETSSGVATAVATAIDALALVSSEADQAVVKITSDNNLAVVDAGAGDSGVSVDIKAQSFAGILAPDSSVTAITSTPSSY